MGTMRGDDALEIMGLDIEAELLRSGVSKEDAAKIAVSVTQKLRQLYGGSNVYFTKNHLKNIDQRDAEIFSLFHGNNYTELAFQYGLSEMRIRQIIEKIALCQRDKNSQSLLVRGVSKNYQ